MLYGRAYTLYDEYVLFRTGLQISAHGFVCEKRFELECSHGKASLRHKSVSEISLHSEAGRHHDILKRTPPYKILSYVVYLFSLSEATSLDKKLQQ